MRFGVQGFRRVGIQRVGDLGIEYSGVSGFSCRGFRISVSGDEDSDTFGYGRREIQR